jgi:hypothetical protein
MSLPSRYIVRPLAAVALFTACAALACVEGEVRGEAVSAEREAGTMAQGEEASMQMVGAGWFHAAEIVKKGGSTDQTWVTVELDGEPLMSTSFAILKNRWMQQQNTNILATVRTVGDESVMTLWYTPDIKFNTHATVRIGVEETGVDNLRMRAVLSRALPHSHPAGQAGALAALPAFK